MFINGYDDEEMTICGGDDDEGMTICGGDDDEDMCIIGDDDDDEETSIGGDEGCELTSFSATTTEDNCERFLFLSCFLRANTLNIALSCTETGTCRSCGE